MAKVGAGDPRWIVSERQDGQNVNAWHWQERSLNEKVHDALKNLFKDFSLSPSSNNNTDDGLDIKIKEVSEIDGDVTVAQRKQKIMCYFELKMVLKYTGTETASGDEVSGNIKIPDVDHDSFREDNYTMTVAATSSGASMSKAEKYVYNKARSMIRKVIKDYFEDLYVEYHVGKNAKTGEPMTSSTSANNSASSTATSSTSAPAAAPKKTSSSSSSGSPTTGSPDHEATSFEQTFLWKVPPKELWPLLTDAPRASAYTRAPAKIDPQPNGAFEFMGGAMSGYFVSLEHPSRITMQWRLSSWPSGTFSSVVITMTQEGVSETKMSFAQVGIPAGEMERVKTGWMCNFWDPIKMVFGFQYELR